MKYAVEMALYGIIYVASLMKIYTGLQPILNVASNWFRCDIQSLIKIDSGFWKLKGGYI
jgi:hypothetical protein